MTEDRLLLVAVIVVVALVAAIAIGALMPLHLVVKVVEQGAAR